MLLKDLVDMANGNMEAELINLSPSRILSVDFRQIVFKDVTMLNEDAKEVGYQQLRGELSPFIDKAMASLKECERLLRE